MRKTFFILLAALQSLSAQSRPSGVSDQGDGALVLRAYQYSFPGHVEKVEQIDGDWTIKAGGETYYWAGGRLLPRGLLKERDKWGIHSFSPYPQSALSPQDYSPRFIEELRAQGEEALPERDDLHHGFEAALYGGQDRRQIEARLERIRFLGKEISVHRDIVQALARIDGAVRKAALWDPETAAFIASIGQAGGYNWREIRGSRRMSYHSWGLAVDIQPAELGGKAIYWRWERIRSRNWMLVPLEKRWKPPDQVIRIFENEGFIWGGKWPLYDNMHFEYRPEIHEINRLIAAESADPAGSSGGRAGQDIHHLYPLPASGPKTGFMRNAKTVWDRLKGSFGKPG